MTENFEFCLACRFSAAGPEGGGAKGGAAGCRGDETGRGTRYPARVTGREPGAARRAGGGVPARAAAGRQGECSWSAGERWPPAGCRGWLLAAGGGRLARLAVGHPGPGGARRPRPDRVAPPRLRRRGRRGRPGWCIACGQPARQVNAGSGEEEAEANRTWVACARSDRRRLRPPGRRASGTAGDTSVGVLSGDPRHSAAVRDAITAGLRSGALAGPPITAPGLAGVALVGGRPRGSRPHYRQGQGQPARRGGRRVVADRLGARVSCSPSCRRDVLVIERGQVKVPYRRQNVAGGRSSEPPW